MISFGVWFTLDHCSAWLFHCHAVNNQDKFNTYMRPFEAVMDAINAAVRCSVLFAISRMSGLLALKFYLGIS